MTQPKIEGVGQGIPRMLYASDGSDWYAVKVRDSGILEVCSKGGDKIFGFESAYSQRASETNASVGNNTLSSTAVPAGKVHVYTTITAVNTISDITRITLYGVFGGVDRVIDSKFPSAALDFIAWSGWLVVEAGNYVRAEFDGCIAGDDLYLDICGFVMNAP